MFNITPVASLFEECATNLGFSHKKALRIRQAVEELLVLRINESADDVGDIGILLQYMRNFLRITVTDFGDDNDNKQNEQQKIALAILLKLVDDYDVSRLDDGQYQVRIDFTYDKDFDITEFLMKHERIE
jgi:anti-sigma regulatory factor (Ser/Thr protein kinase)